jgi:predicted house-cleaning noncanonical NTP pyrophosphatase (MazG superfamily)
MRKFILNKVVRSGIIARMEADKTEVKSEALEGTRAVRAVLAKVIEETEEALTAPPDKLATEFADIQTALKDAITLSGIPPDEVDALEVKKAAERGRFVPTIFVETVNVQDDDPMATYYGNDPERFPEIRE